MTFIIFAVADQFSAWSVALIDPDPDTAIELSYGNLIERKRLPLSTKPNLGTVVGIGLGTKR
jgi:hypothetical protein